MKHLFKVLFSLFVFSVVSITIYSQTTAIPSITIKKLPKTIDEFVAMRDGVANNEQGGAATFLVALIIYTMDPDLGLKCLTVALDQDLLTAGDVYKGYQPANSEMSLINSQLIRDNKQYIANSYVKGATPDNQYKLPEANLTFEFVKNPYSEQSDGSFKVFVKSSGADTPRPIRVKKNNRGIWKASNISSVLVGVRPPIIEKDDNL